LERGGTMRGMKTMGAGLLLASIALVLFCPAADASSVRSTTTTPYGGIAGTLPRLTSLELTC